MTMPCDPPLRWRALLREQSRPRHSQPFLLNGRMLRLIWKSDLRQWQHSLDASTAERRRIEAKTRQALSMAIWMKIMYRGYLAASTGLYDHPWIANHSLQLFYPTPLICQHSWGISSVQPTSRRRGRGNRHGLKWCCDVTLVKHTGDPALIIITEVCIPGSLYQRFLCTCYLRTLIHLS